MPIELPPQYDPKAVETDIYQQWLATGAFHAVAPQTEADKARGMFSIVIPPPNVTGALHLGHAINGTIQDILARHHRMKGENTLWMPGIDHAGIATQAVVEKTIFEKEGKNRHDLGREELVRRIWEWKEKYGDRIISQQQALGASCDWERTRFTLDDICAKAVREAFFRMFKDGLIFRGKRLVNWDTHLQTAVADDEIYRETVRGQMTSIKYPLADAPSEFLIVATTRPETMLGDTAVAVHPDDPRYKHLIGQHVIVPLVGRRIPIIADGLLVDPKFGTGVVKVTPAHDPNDYATGLRHGLEQINLLTPDGKVNEKGSGTFFGKDYSYVGLKFATAARKQVLADLETLELIAEAKPHEHEVGHSDRSKTPIEPYLSDQWFVRMGDITETHKSEISPSETRLSETRPLGSVSESKTRESEIDSTTRKTSPSEIDPNESIRPHSNALAYFISFHTYATWLHGRDEGSVDPDNNIVNSPFIPPSDELLIRDAANLANPPMQLSLEQRQSISRTIQEVVAFRGWMLHALNVRTTHVHAVVSGPHSPEKMMNDFKAWATRRLREAGLADDQQKVWSRHGSTPYLWKGEDLQGAVSYTLKAQGENAPGCVYSRSEAHPSETRPSGSVSANKTREFEMDTTARLDAPRKDGVHSHRPSAETLPNGRVSDGRISDGVLLGNGQRASGLAQAAMDAVTQGRVRITPERYAKSYLDWLGQKRDWCISRQLWWGHRIPVWRMSSEKELMLGRDALALVHKQMMKLVYEDDRRTQRPGIAARTLVGGTREMNRIGICIAPGHDDVEAQLEGLGFTQDPDVLDTWFSSALWPLSTMGWPANGTTGKPEDQLLPAFYPTSVLSTAREILTLWVARMVMFGLYCKGDVPFKNVYIHPVIQDGDGRQMSKSKGNGVDPVDIIQSHGADALRFTLAQMTTETQDIRMPVQLICPHCAERFPNPAGEKTTITCPKCKKPLTRALGTATGTDEAPLAKPTSDRFDAGRNFANKVWNASRFILSNIDEQTANSAFSIQHSELKALEDRWILSRVNATIKTVEDAINGFHFSEMAAGLYQFFWTDLCDWYLEISKARKSDPAVQAILLHCLKTSLKLLHPVMPFVAEAIWAKLPKAPGEAMLVTASWPVANATLHDAAAEEQIAVIQAITSGIRDLHNTNPAAKGKDVVIRTATAEMQRLIAASRSIIEALAGAKLAEISTSAAKPADSATKVLAEAEIYIGGAVDRDAERKRLTKRREELLKLIGGQKGKLSNEGFVSKAPPAIVQGLRDQLAKLEDELAAVEKNLAELGPA